MITKILVNAEFASLPFDLPFLECCLLSFHLPKIELFTSYACCIPNGCFCSVFAVFGFLEGCEQHAQKERNFVYSPLFSGLTPMFGHTTAKNW